MAKAIRLAKWDAMKGTGVVYPKKGTFARDSLAESVKAMRAMARGTLSAKAKKTMGPVKAPPRGERLSGRRGMALLNSYAGSGYRGWNEAAHPRVPAGSAKGGEFASKGGKGSGSMGRVASSKGTGSMGRGRK